MYLGLYSLQHVTFSGVKLVNSNIAQVHSTSFWVMLLGHPSPKPTTCWSNMPEIGLLNQGKLSNAEREKRTTLKTTRPQAEEVQIISQYMMRMFELLIIKLKPCKNYTQDATSIRKERLALLELQIWVALRTLVALSLLSQICFLHSQMVLQDLPQRLCLQIA